VRAAGAAGVLVTHSALAAAQADRVLELDHGRLR
jgi:predicted ABC-type transport system involved in lysophospholipase L1 biosynthesis ATPase subunit